MCCKQDLAIQGKVYIPAIAVACVLTEQAIFICRRVNGIDAFNRQTIGGLPLAKSILISLTI
jgi:hypothetical protein